MTTNDPLPSRTSPRRLKLRSRGGCIECKLRKRKCDEVRPNCGPCHRLGHHCEWLDHLTPEERREVLDRHKQRGKKISVDVKFPDTVTTSITTDHASVRTSFLLHRLFAGANKSPGSGDGNALTVLTELHFANDASSLTYSWLHAMAMVYWGRVHKDQQMVSAGYQAKGFSLVRLQDALKHNVPSGDVLAAVSLARLFETMMPGARSQWVIHAQGLTHLMHALGPEAFRTPAMRRLIENNRYVMIASASALRKPTILNMVKWKTIPWEGVHKDMVQRALDIYARIPGIHAAWDEYQAANNEQTESNCVKQIREALLDLHQWRLAVDTEIEASVKVWEPVNTSVTSPWRFAVSFTQLYHAYAISLFDTIIIVLGRYIHRLPGAATTLVEGPVLEHAPDTLLYTSVLPLGDPLKRAAMAADEISSIIPWAMQDHVKGAGSMYMGVPALVSDQFWQMHDAEKAKMFGPVIHEIHTTWDSLLLLDHVLLR